MTRLDWAIPALNVALPIALVLGITYALFRFIRWCRARRKPTPPVKWLTYRERLQRDVGRAYTADTNRAVFNEDYKKSLTEIIRTLDSWTIKLYVAQLAISLYLVTRLVTSSPKEAGTILGVQIVAPELLLAAAAIISVVFCFVCTSRDVRIWTLEGLTQFDTPKQFIELKKLAVPSAYNIAMYIPKDYEWKLSPGRVAKSTLIVSVVLGTGFFIVAILVPTILLFYILFDVYSHPTLAPPWPTAIVCFVLLTQLFGWLWIFRFLFPQPYSDGGFR